MARKKKETDVEVEEPDFDAEGDMLDVNIKGRDAVKELAPQNPEIKIDEIKEDRILTSTYSQYSVSDKEKEQAKELVMDFNKFLAKEADIDLDETENVTTVPSGIDLIDTILGGGVAMKFIMVVGPPGSGKSALAAKFISTGQKKFPGKFIAVYCDSEESMSEDRLKQLGIDSPTIKPVCNVSVEKLFKIIEGLCAYKIQNPELMNIPSIVVWDSIANSSTEYALKSEDPNSILGEKARLLAFLIPKYIHKLNKYNISLLTINQFRDKIDIGIYKSPSDLKGFDKNIPGGKSVSFNTFQLICLKHGTDLKGLYGFPGSTVNMKAIKNKLFTPFVDITVVFSFEHGFSNFWTNFELLKDKKRLKAGPWCTLESLPVDSTGKKLTFRQAQAIELYRDNEEFRNAFNKEVEDVLKKEFIEKYKSDNNNQVDV